MPENYTIEDYLNTTSARKAKHIAGIIITAIVGRFCVIGYHIATRQLHIELSNASGQITDSKIKVTATLQNSGDADGITAIRHTIYWSGTTFETQRKEVIVPAPWHT